MAMGNILGKILLYIEAIGWIIPNMALELNYGMIVLNIIGNIIQEKKKELEVINGPMALRILVNGKII